MYKEGDFIKFDEDKHVFGLFYAIVLKSANPGFVRFKIIGTNKRVNLHKTLAFKVDGKMSQHITKVDESEVKYGII
jgi:hypothetical protein